LCDPEFKTMAFFNDTTVSSFMGPLSWKWIFLCTACLGVGEMGSCKEMGEKKLFARIKKLILLQKLKYITL
jgi:hypothetical protein